MVVALKYINFQKKSWIYLIFVVIKAYQFIYFQGQCLGVVVDEGVAVVEVVV